MKTKQPEMTRKSCTPDQLRCWKALSWIVGGDHHMQRVYECGYGIRTTLFGEASTHDFNTLTRMVLIAHIDSVRIAVTNSGPHRIGITAHPRKIGDSSTCEGHRTIDELIEHAKELRDRLGKPSEK
jgi:hypothetical protein